MHRRLMIPSTTSGFRTELVQGKCRQIVAAFVLIFLCQFMATNVVRAQDTGQGIISGTVADSANASVSKAKVAIRNTETNVIISATTNDTGYYEVRNLNAGSYEITVIAKGFEKLVRSGITLLANGHPEIALTLKPGNVTETIVVNSSAPLIDTQSVSVGQVLTSEELSALPNGQNAIWLAMLAPGVQSNLAQNYQLGGADINFNGPGPNFGAYGRIGYNEYTLDGAPNMAGQRGEALNLSPEDQGQIAVNLSQFDASVGHTYGLSIVQTTKAGTNDLHGGIRYRRYDLRQFAMQHFQRFNYQYNFRANNCSQTPNSPACIHTAENFGWPGTHLNYGDAGIGGPVFIPKVFDGRNRLFFFVGVVAEAPNSASSQTISLPTAQEKKGDFSDLPVSATAVPATYTQACGATTPWFGQYQIYNPYSAVLDSSGVPHRAPICGNKIPQSMISTLPIVSMVNGFMPDPNPGSLATGGNNYTWEQASFAEYRSVTNRYDYAITGADHLYFRWTRAHFNQLGQQFETGDQGRQTVDHWITTGALGYSRILSPKAYFDTVIGATQWTGYGYNYPGFQAYKPSSLGLPTYMDTYAGKAAQMPLLSFSGYQQVGNTFIAVTHFRSLAIRANLTDVQGPHTIRAGVEWRQQTASGGGPGSTNSAPGPSGQLVFDNTYDQESMSGAPDTPTYPTNTTGLSYAAFLLGVQSTANAAIVPSTSRSNPYYGAYIGDTWRVNRKMTILPGIRYEFEYGPTELHNRQIVGWDPNAPLTIAAIADNMYQALLPKITGTPAQLALLPTHLDVRGGPVYAGVNGASRRQWQNDWRILPRLGIAYSVTPTTVLRGGIGYFFDTLNVLNENQTIDSDGFSATTTANSSNVYGTDFSSSAPPLTNPFPLSNGSRFTPAIGSSLGADYYSGSANTIGIYDHSRVPAKSLRGQLSYEHQIGNSMTIQVAYVASQTKHITLDGNQNSSHSNAAGYLTETAIPSKYFMGGNQPNTAMNSFLGQNVANPFYINNLQSLQISNPAYYNLLTKGGYATRPTIQLNQLVHAYPQMSTFRLYKSIGGSQFQEFQVNFSKRISNGLVANFSFQKNYQKDRDYFANLFETHPSLESTTLSPPWRLTGTGVWNLPFGYGKQYATSGWKSAVFGGFQLAGSFEQNPGTLLIFSANGSGAGISDTFYIGDTSNIRLKHPVYNVSGGTATIGGFNTKSVTVAASSTNGVTTCSYTGTGFVSIYSPVANTSSSPLQCLPTNYNLRNFPIHVENVRSESLANWNFNLGRTFNTGRRFKTQARVDLLNAFNHQRVNMVNGAQMSPNNQQFGLITQDNGNGREIIYQVFVTF